MVGGQDELVFDGDSMVVGDRRGGARPRPAVRRGTGRRRPGAGRRRRSTTGTLPRACVHVVVSTEPLDRYAAAGPADVPAARPGRGCVARSSGSGCATTCARTASARSCSACPAGSTRRSWRPSPRTPWARENVVAISIPSKYSSEGSKDDAAELAKNLGLDYRVVPIQPMVDAVPRVPRTHRRRRGEPPGARPRRHLDGRCPTRRAPGPRQLQQERGVGRLLHDLRRQRRRVRADQGRAQDAGVGAGPLAQPDAEARGEPPPIPEARSPSRRRPSCGPARPTRTRCRPTRSSTRSSPATSGWPTGRNGSSPPGSTRRTVDKVIQLVDRAEWKRRQFAPGPKISPLAFGKDRRLPITSRWREEGEDRS